MNEIILSGKWDQLRGEIQAKWGKLTDDELDQIAGNRKKLVGKLKEAYGIAQEEAERQLEEWESGHYAP